MRLLTSLHRTTDALIGLFLVLLFLAGLAEAAGTVNLAWTANTESDIAGYKVLCGTASGTYTQEQNVGISPAATLSGLTAGTTYYCVVQAVTAAALYSPSSEEISFTVPQATAPEISVEQTSDAPLADGVSTVSLGDVPTAATTNRTLIIRNLGSASLTGLSFTLDGADAASFGISGNIPYALLASTNGSFESEFAGWTASGNVRVLQNAAATSGACLVEFNSSETQPNGTLTQTFATVPGTTYALSFDAGVLSFNSNQQVIRTTVTGSGTLLTKSIPLTGPGDGSTRWSSQNLTFVANSASTTLAFADLSTTTAAIDLRLDNVRVVAQSSQTALAITSLEPGASTSFDVNFKAASVGTKTAAIHIASNDSDENPFDFAVTANVAGQPEISVRQSPAIELTDGAAGVNFSNSVIGTSSAVETLIIQNTGSANLTNIVVTTDGAQTEEFVVIALSKSTLVPGESTTVLAYFQPTSIGTKSAAIHIASNDADENPFDINLIGNGVAIPQISVTKADGTSLTNGATLPQGSVNLGSNGASQIVTIRNSGTGNLTGIAVTADGSNPNDFIIENPTSAALAPGSSVDFKINFKPTAGGERTAAIHIASSDAAHSPFNLQLTGSGIANPEIAVTLDDTTPLTDGFSAAAFGNVNLGSASGVRTFTISNSGTANLTGLALATDGNASDFIVSGLSATVVAPGKSASFTVAFKPTAGGSRSAAIHIASNDADENPFDIRLEGAGVPIPEIAIDQADGSNLVSGSAVMAFGNANIGTNGAVKSFTIRNLGTASLTNLAITSDGPQAADYAVDGLPVTSLAPGASTTFQVVFKPTAAGTRTAAVHITSNDADESPYHISLSGTGVAVPEISITRADNTELTDGASTLASGSVNLGSSGTTQIITIRNTGTGNLTDLAIAKNGANASDFTVSGPAAASLVPGAFTTFTVTFTPSAAGTRTAAIHVASNDADENPFDIELTGTCITNPEIAITRADNTPLTDSGSTVNSGKVDLGSTSADQSLTIKNLGNANLTGLSISIDGANASNFTTSALAATTLAPGASTTFSISFTPAAEGSRWALLHVASNDADENPFDIKLEGTGVAIPEIAVTRADDTPLTDSGSTVDSGKVNLGFSSAAQPLTIKNLGTASLNGLSISIDGANAADFAASALSVDALAPGAGATFSISFTPSAEGSRWAVLHIASNDADKSPFDIKLEGIGGTVPVLAIGQPDGSWLAHGETSAALGSVIVGTTGLVQNFTLKNIGTAPLTGMKVVSSGAQSAEFLLSAPAETSLAPGASTTFQVSFKPNAAGTRRAALQFFSDDKSESAFTLALSGIGVTVPEIAVSASSGANLPTREIVAAFDGEIIGTTSDAQSFTIRNLGSANLTNLALSVTGPHASDFETSSLSKTTLAPGTSITFKIYFTPSAAGARAATLQIASNDADKSPFNISLKGTGIVVPEIAINLNGGSNLTDGSAFLNFGNVALSRKSAKKTITITNQGTAKLSGLTLLKNGLNGADFTVSNLRTNSLAPGASTTLNLTFKPTLSGTRWASIRISSNDADEKDFDIVLTGKCNSSSGSKKSAPLAVSKADAPAVSGIEVIAGKKYRTLTITWPAGQRDFSSTVEVSSNLLEWFSGKKHTTVLVSNATTLKVRDNTPVTQDDKRYIRLKK